MQQAENLHKVLVQQNLKAPSQVAFASYTLEHWGFCILVGKRSDPVICKAEQLTLEAEQQLEMIMLVGLGFLPALLRRL